MWNRTLSAAFALALTLGVTVGCDGDATHRPGTEGGDSEADLAPDAARPADDAGGVATPDAATPDAATPDAAAGDVGDAALGEAVDAAPDGAPDTGPDAAPAAADGGIDTDGDTAPDDAGPPPTVQGFVWTDRDESATSIHAGPFDPAVDAPAAGVTVTLLRRDGDAVAEEAATSGADGRVAFSDVADGAWFAALTPRPAGGCTTGNCPRRAPEAVRAGRISVLTIGDSVAVAPPETPTPRFPERLRRRLAAVAGEAVDVNVAIAGSTTPDWLPGTAPFEERAAPALADADVVVITLGGNDLKNYMGDIAARDLPALMALAEGFPAFYDGVIENILTIIAEIRVRAPHVDVVYCVYPPYGRSSLWRDGAGSFAGVVDGLVSTVFRDLRARVAAVPDVVVVDVFGALRDEDVDLYLKDPLHLSARGHETYAAEIFRALGGLETGPTPFATERSWGLAP